MKVASLSGPRTGRLYSQRHIPGSRLYQGPSGLQGHSAAEWLCHRKIPVTSSARSAVTAREASVLNPHAIKNHMTAEVAVQCSIVQMVKEDAAFFMVGRTLRNAHKHAKYRLRTGIYGRKSLHFITAQKQQNVLSTEQTFTCLTTGDLLSAPTAAHERGDELYAKRRCCPHRHV